MSDILLIEDIMENLRTVVLPRINGTGDYRQTVKKVTRTFLSPQEVDKTSMPWITIVNNDMGAPLTPLSSCGEFTVGNSMTSISDGYPVELLSYVTVENDLGDENSLDKQMNYIQSDIMRAIAVDITLGGLVESIIPVFIANRLAPRDNLIGIAYTRFMLKFTFNPFN